MKRAHTMIAIALTGLLGLGTLVTPIAASASEEGKRNTTYALGAAALGLLLTQKNKLPGLLAAGGAAYAYTQYNKDVQARHRWEQNDDYYNSRNHQQNNGYRNHQNNDNGSGDYGYRQNDNNNSGNYTNSDNQGSGYRYHQDNSQSYPDNNRSSSRRWGSQGSGHSTARRDTRTAH